MCLPAELVFIVHGKTVEPSAMRQEELSHVVEETFAVQSQNIDSSDQHVLRALTVDVFGEGLC